MEPDGSGARPGAHDAGSERTLLASWLLSAPGPLVTGIAVAMSSSATQIADAIRRTVELGALFTGWWTYRRRRTAPGPAEVATLERRSRRTVAAAMFLSGLAMLAVGVYRFFRHEPGGNVTVGLAVASLGLLVNGLFWVRYARILRRGPDPVIAGQLRLYRAKTVVDSGVVLALLAVAFIPDHPVTHYADSLGSVAVAGYLIQQALTSGTH